MRLLGLMVNKMHPAIMRTEGVRADLYYELEGDVYCIGC